MHQWNLRRSVFLWPAIGMLNACTHYPTNCQSEPDLDGFVACVETFMPRRGEGTVRPTVSQQTQWYDVAFRMIDGGDCAALTGYPRPPGLAVFTFSDSVSGKTYCVLHEYFYDSADSRVENAWGTLIVPIAGDIERRGLHFQVAHPVFDIDTLEQATRLFDLTGAHSLALGGGHKHADDLDGDRNIDAGEESVCDASYFKSDNAHTDETMLLATTRAIQDHHRDMEDYTVIQFHAMNAKTCPTLNVYMTWGADPSVSVTDGKLHSLFSAVSTDNPGWSVGLPVAACSLHGEENIQGRLLNDVALSDVCDFGVDSSTSEHFIHIEQDSGVYRDPANWEAAFRAVF